MIPFIHNRIFCNEFYWLIFKNILVILMKKYTNLIIIENFITCDFVRHTNLNFQLKNLVKKKLEISMFC